MIMVAESISTKKERNVNHFFVEHNILIKEKKYNIWEHA
jgi:hypothetical protein